MIIVLWLGPISAIVSFLIGPFYPPFLLLIFIRLSYSSFLFAFLIPHFYPHDVIPSFLVRSIRPTYSRVASCSYLPPAFLFCCFNVSFVLLYSHFFSYRFSLFRCLMSCHFSILRLAKDKDQIKGYSCSQEYRCTKFVKHLEPQNEGH